MESSSHFSFGVKPTNTIPNNGGQQRPGKPSNSNSSRDVVSLSSSQEHLNVIAKGQKNIMLKDQEQDKGDTESQRQAQSIEPTPYTVVQTLTARLRQIQATHATSIEMVPSRHTTKQGQLPVIYDMDDLMKKLTVDCKYTLIDTTSIKRTRASMAKVKVQVYLTKSRPRHVWIGLDDEDLTIGRWQPMEYENIPTYCAYCKHQGYMIGESCNFKIRDEDFQRRKN
ncbi:hypothetical protein H5410_003058 [Solanum commersonii]|uniref:Uncharacterized protein n=1 Tax=Solanum commersonii TaxID=4109 RepID=A0A9J6B3M0_SOLCO|nr:hypothetical protein H5410_003058 [Solanum commersonii]